MLFRDILKRMITYVKFLHVKSNSVVQLYTKFKLNIIIQDWVMNLLCENTQIQTDEITSSLRHPVFSWPIFLNFD